VIADFDNATLAFEMAKEEGDDDLLTEADEQLFDLVGADGEGGASVTAVGQARRGGLLLHDLAGDGGTEANDWAEMLMRMYIYYFERMGWKVEELSKTFGTEVGVDNVTLADQGALRVRLPLCERGTHRLASVSPFNAQGKRQTSFATVDVVPEFARSRWTSPTTIWRSARSRRSSGSGRSERQQGRLGGPSGAQADGDHGRLRRTGTSSRTSARRWRSCRRSSSNSRRREREREVAEASGGKLEHRGWGAQIRSVRDL
jgi:peptide chain release factor 2